jgi:hypothetical protein
MTDREESESIFTANTAEGEVIFIGQAHSGKNGYFCRSCGFELVAKIGIGKYVAHFAHAVRNAEQKAQCTFADESYRHKLAKVILQQLKQVKVPEVLVHSPDMNLRDAKRLKAAAIIKAHSVEIELTLRLTPDGILHLGRFDKIELEASGDFYIRPDVTFFDEHRRPILLIELVATHRPDAEKLARLNLIGIDTIQIDLPRHSAQAIEHCFHTTEFTKWLYNHEQANANYAELSQIIGGRIPEFDKVQEQLTREDIRCRTNRIKNLIRGVERYLESESHRQATKAISAAIERVIQEGAIVDERLQQRTKSIEQSIRERFKDQVAACGLAEAAAKAEEGELDSEEADIEAKYAEETGRIDRAEETIRQRADPRVRKIEAEISDTERTITDSQNRKREDERTLQDAYQRTSEANKRTVDEYEATYTAIRREYDQAESATGRARRAIGEAAANEQRLRKRIAELRKQIEGVTAPRIEAVRAEVDRLEGTERDGAESFRERTTREIEHLEHAAQQAVDSRDISQLPAELAPFKGLLAGWQTVGDCQNQGRLNQRTREIIREIESAAWKSWYRPR